MITRLLQTGNAFRPRCSRRIDPSASIYLQDQGAHSAAVIGERPTAVENRLPADYGSSIGGISFPEPPPSSSNDVCEWVRSLRHPTALEQK